MNNLIIKIMISFCTMMVSFPLILKCINHVLKNDIKYLKEECEELDRLLKELRSKENGINK